LDRLKDLINLIPEKYKKAGVFLLFFTLILIFIEHQSTFAKIFGIFLGIFIVGRLIRNKLKRR